MDFSSIANDIGVQNNIVLHDNLFPLWEHLLTKANRRVGLYEIVDHSEQNTAIPRDFRNSPGVNQTYQFRINIFRSFLEEKARLEWPTIDFKSEIHNAVQEYIKISLILASSSNETNAPFSCEPQIATEVELAKPHKSIVLIGAVMKYHRVNYSDMQQMCKKIGVLPLPMQHKESFGADNEDNTFLIDNASRIQLKLPSHLSHREMVSGIVCAIKGSILEKRFIVEDIIFPTSAPPVWPIVSKFHNIEMVFLSGLHIGRFAEDYIHRNLLLEYLQGLTGCPAEQEHIVKRKTRAFILGNVFCSNRKRDTTESIDMVAETAKLVDDFISQLSDTMEVYLVPGVNEPTCTPILPQPPIHSMILPKSNQKANFRKLSNPANLKVSVTNPALENYEPPISVPESESVQLVLSSGKNVKDAMKSCSIKCPLQMGKKLLEWSHLNPTSQQVIPLCSGSSEDFFSLKGVLPHIFAIGNQNSFGVENWNGVKVISVPDFEKTGTIALLNFELDVLPMSFKILF